MLDLQEVQDGIRDVVQGSVRDKGWLADPETPTLSPMERELAKVWMD